ncbi:gamma-glutamyl-gamma-aminobutyrate hydrolase family protein [Nocardia sp. NPDC004860]|uniref:gamma-glutamyl-gamma-aminobutyrate hydrolase family protein n=1 Tax=Nocardia sp. NPDC004860 TaxID=3154557 RepID=UPI00339F9252
MEERLAVDPTGFVFDQPEPWGVPRIAVVASLWFPGMSGQTRELMTQLTATAFQAVRDAGGWPTLVDSSAPRAEADTVVGAADGMLFLGGGDVDARLYGVEGPVPNSYGVDRAADDYCLDLLGCALAADQPVLAICRGSQLLNVVCGGSLIPDIEDFAPHRGRPGASLFVDETIELVEGSRIRDILKRDLVTVRSAHHQAVDRLGEGLMAAAVAADGVVEATEHIGKRWVLGLQWHPEEIDGDADDRSRIFGAFVDETARVAASR